MRRLTAAGGVADMDGIPRSRCSTTAASISGVVIHVVAVADLGRAAMAAPIMRDNAVALVQEVKHLRVPVVGAQRPAMMEDDRLGVLRAPILVEDLDAVLGGDIAHGSDLLSVRGEVPGSGWAAAGRMAGAGAPSPSAKVLGDDAIRKQRRLAPVLAFHEALHPGLHVRNGRMRHRCFTPAGQAAIITGRCRLGHVARQRWPGVVWRQRGHALQRLGRDHGADAQPLLRREPEVRPRPRRGCRRTRPPRRRRCRSGARPAAARPPRGSRRARTAVPNTPSSTRAPVEQSALWPEG